MDQKEFWKQFDIIATAAFINSHRFQRVALQFPDELLKHSVAVAAALKKELGKQRTLSVTDVSENDPIRLFVMADTTFGSCCADEVAAMHADAQCIVHYGNACLSMTTRLPVWYVFGREALDVEDCSTQLSNYASAVSKPLLVMFGLEYSHEIPNIRERLSTIQDRKLNVTFADIPPQCIKPSSNKRDTWVGDSNSAPVSDHDNPHEAGRVDTDGWGAITVSCSVVEKVCSITASEVSSSNGQSFTCWPTATAFEGQHYTLGGLKWIIPKDATMDDYVILWIGDECPGLTNATLVFNTSTVVRYDCFDKVLVTDVARQSKVLKRRYYYVERAKDANVVGIVVGTLGVAGYADVIHKIRRMVESAGKKAYTLVMGKPNSAKLANFPECEVFVLVACPQTALIDCKDYLAPILTPFEAELAFIEGKHWTGAYRLEFNDLGFPSTSENSVESRSDEPRYSFFSGGYVGTSRAETQAVQDGISRAVVLPKPAEHALQLQSNRSSIITKERAALDIQSGADYLASRTYQGLDINEGGDHGLLAVPGRKGRAAGYLDELYALGRMCDMGDVGDEAIRTPRVLKGAGCTRTKDILHVQGAMTMDPGRNGHDEFESYVRCEPFKT